jgi:hypothetical protein
MEFNWEDGSTTPVNMLQKVVGLKRNGKRPLSCTLHPGDWEKINATPEGIRWFNQCIVPATQYHHG